MSNQWRWWICPTKLFAKIYIFGTATETSPKYNKSIVSRSRFHSFHTDRKYWLQRILFFQNWFPFINTKRNISHYTIQTLNRFELKASTTSWFRVSWFRLPKWMTSIISFLDNFLCISVMSSSSLHITFAKSKHGRWLWGVVRDDTSLRVTLGISSVWSFFLLFFLGTLGSGKRVGKSYVTNGAEGVRISEVELIEDRWDTVGEDAVSWSVEIVDLPLSPHSESDSSSIVISWWEENVSFNIKFHPQQMHKKEYTPKSEHDLSQMLTPEEWITVAKVRIVELLAL